MKILVKISKFIHKWFGLMLAIFLAYMSITGIILNHPETLSEIDVPQSITPRQYILENWNRSSLIGLLPSDSLDSHPEYIFGNNGVYAIENGCIQSIMAAPFPKSAWNMKTKSLIKVEINKTYFLLAATFEGLYSYNIQEKSWSKIELPRGAKKMMKVIQAGDSIYAFSQSEVFIASAENLNFKKVILQKIGNENNSTMLEFFFDLHSGDIFGLPGRILFDIAAIVLFFLSLSAFYIWLYPKKHKSDVKRKQLHSLKQLNMFKLFNKYHLKLGIVFAVILLIIAATGLFMRPPLVVYLLSGEVSSNWYLGMKSDNKFEGKIRNVMYDAIGERLIIDAKDGIWVETDKASREFVQSTLPVPIFAMGATVFEQEADGNLLVGSFSGLFRINYKTGRVIDIINGSSSFNQNSIRPSENMVTGYFRDSRDNEYVSTHFSGLFCINGKFDERYSMPKKVVEEFRLSLWNYAFELHNARFFADWIGNWYILIIPLGALLFVFIIISGIIDWMWRRRLFSKKNKTRK